MTRAEYEAHCHQQGLDPDFPIKEWTWYTVTGWYTDKPHRRMYVYTNEITADKVTGQITTDDYNFPSTSRWSRTMAERWTWTESDTRLPKK